MNERTLALIGLRLLALYLFIQIIDTTPVTLVLIINTVAQAPHGVIPYGALALSGLMMVISLLIPLVLWVYSKQLSALLVKTTPSTAGAGTDVTNTSEYWAIAFSAIGLFVLVNALPEILLFIAQVLNGQVGSNGFTERPMPNMLLLIPLSAKAVIGLTLLFKARGIARLVQKVRHL